jgi:hypothetical protein
MAVFDTTMTVWKLQLIGIAVILAIFKVRAHTPIVVGYLTGLDRWWSVERPCADASARRFRRSSIGFYESPFFCFWLVQRFCGSTRPCCRFRLPRHCCW